MAVIGARYASHIESYPFVIEHERKTFERTYRIPLDLPAGSYYVRIVDVARRNPLFDARQTLRVPFEISP